MTDKLSQRIVKLVKDKGWDELQDLVINTEDDWLMQLVSKWVRYAESPQWVGGVLSSLTCTTRESTVCRVKIYKHVLRCVREGVCVSERCAGELVGALMVRVETFPSSALVELIDHYLTLIEEGHPLQGRWVDLFAKLMTCVGSREEMTVDGQQTSGDDYRYQVLKTLCDLPWYPETATCLLPIFSDMDLPKEEMEDIMFKVERVLKDVEYQSVPPILYQLINLARTKLAGRVISLVINYFTRQERKLGKEIRKKAERSADINGGLDADDENIDDGRHKNFTEAKGTVILHVTHFAQYNPGLVRDYIKFIKSSTWLPEKLITPFNLALSLSLSSIDRYQEQILGALKTCLLRVFREEDCGQQSRWLRDTWMLDCDVTKAFNTTIDNCVMGWDQVSQGLVQLSFSLLESGGGFKSESYISQQATRLATTIIPRIVKKQPHLTHSVITTLSNYLLSSSVPNLYIEVFGKLAKTVPLSLLEHFSDVRAPLDFLEFLPPSPAPLLLQAYSPLFRMNMALKDTVMLILRKMLFSKKLESRHVAVRGFLQFLRNFRLLGALPSSQASMSFSSSLSTSVTADVHTVFNSTTNEALCLELLGILRRCFSQQAEVKTTFYQGLPEVCVSNPKLSVSILEMLVQHARGYLDLRPDTLNPVVLSKVVVVRGDSAVLVEPMRDVLGSLAACLSCYNERKDEDDDDETAPEVLNEVCGAFDVLTERLSGCDLEDLGINTNGDFTNNTSSGQTNLMSCQVMVGVFDSLIEHTFLNVSQDPDNQNQAIISLFKSQRKIVDLLREKTGKANKNGEGSKGKKKKGEWAKEKAAKGEGSKGKGRRLLNKQVVIVNNHLSLCVASKILSASLASNSDASAVLRKNHEFQMYLLLALDHYVNTIKKLSKSEKEKILPQLKTVARVLLTECVRKVGAAAADTSDEREVLRLRNSLVILEALILTFNRFYKDKLEAIMREVLGKTDGNELDVLLYKFAKRCQKMLLKILHHENNGPLLKDATVVVHIMSTITQEMDPEGNQITEVQDWLHQLCKDQEPENPELAKALMTFLIKLSNQIKFNHSLTRGVAQELHCKFGDAEVGVEVEEINKFKIVTEHVASAILSSMISHMEDSMNLVELVLNKMKACVTTSTEFDADEVEKCISLKCLMLMKAAHEIIQSALPEGASSEQTLKMVTKLYTMLSLYVKYYLDLYRVKNNTQISDKFEKVVHMSADLISRPVYPMITYIESTQRQIQNKNKCLVAARAFKESRLIPALIFSLEQYERNLITLTKKSKVNLMERMKHSTARDFRIMPNALQEVLQQSGDEEEEETIEDDTRDDNEEANEDEEPPPRAQPKAKKYAGEASGKKSGTKRKSMTTEEEEEEEEEGNENNPNSQNTSAPASKLKKTMSLGRGRTGRRV